MSPLQPTCVFWPPETIPFLNRLKSPRGQALTKHIEKGCVTGLTYKVEGAEIYIRNQRRRAYFIEIDAWEYTIRNESREYPVLSFTYLDMGAGQGGALKSVQNIRLLGRGAPRGHRVADKTLRVARYLMQRVEAGQVPDVARLLALFKFAPADPLMPGFIQKSFSHAHRTAKAGE